MTAGQRRVSTVEELMARSGVAFGTSGARGPVCAMTDEVCYGFAAGFMAYLEERGDLTARATLAVGGDLRASTPRIMGVLARAVADRGCRVVNAGALPSPALAHYGMREGVAAMMVTGSHIPDDRNGIKFTTAHGEILKGDEARIAAQRIAVPGALFGEDGRLREAAVRPGVDLRPAGIYLRRYLDAYPPGCLAGLRVGLYEHSCVGRDLFHDVLSGLGARVTRLGRTDRFVPVDTEAIRDEDRDLARGWARDLDLDCIVSADGDGDRPLLSDERGA